MSLRARTDEWAILVIVPAVFIACMKMAFVFLGDGPRNALDPQLTGG